MAMEPSYFQMTPYKESVENNEFSFHELYLHHTYKGPKPNQSTIINKDESTGLGSTAVNNWEIYDGVDTDAKLVARAQGLHIFAGNWHNSLTIMFETERFKGCTLEVMGANVNVEGEWAIVGGTGEFAMARGVIHRKLYQERVDGKHGNIMKLTIHGFCRSSPTPTKNGPWGGSGGLVRDITEKPKRLESVTIASGDIVDSFTFSYIDQAGQRHTEGPWGGSGGNTQTIQFGPSESVRAMYGTTIEHGGHTVVSSITLSTNLREYGPFGQKKGDPFHAPVFHSIVGFHGRSGIYLDAIGVYTD